MPGILAHYTFAKRYLPEEELPWEEAVLAGTQGPDPFMAYGTNPLRPRKDKKDVNPWGELMHHTPIENVYGPMLSEAQKAEGEQREFLFAYLDGLLMHFSLDRIVHPYVFYRTGFDENGKYAGIYIYYHGFFETLIDESIAKKDGLFIRPDKAMGQLSKKQQAWASKLWKDSATVPLKETAFEESYREYNQVSRLLWSKKGIKRALLKPLLGAKSKPYSLIYPPSLKPFEALDILNESHSAWKDPVSGEERLSSVEDLFEQAHQDFLEVHGWLLKAKQGKDVTLDLKDWAKNLDHDGTPFGSTKKYYSKEILPLL